MPSLSHLALRYLLWMVGLRIIYLVAVQVAGLPSSQATFVILAAVPAMEIGMRARTMATRALAFGEWATIWGVMVSIFAILNIIVPAIVIAQFRATFANPEALTQTVIILAATAAMLALFLWIGTRIKRGA